MADVTAPNARTLLERTASLGSNKEQFNMVLVGGGIAALLWFSFQNESRSRR